MFREDEVFVFLDVETTGLYPRGGDRICEVACLKYDINQNLLGEFNYLVNPERNIPLDVVAIHGISDHIVLEAYKFYEIAEDLSRFLDGAIIVGYNICFDIAFINGEFELIGMPPLKNRIIDLLKVSRDLLPMLNSYKLRNVSTALGLEQKNYHWAMGDVYACAALFFNLIKQAAKKGVDAAGWCLEISNCWGGEMGCEQTGGQDGAG